MSVNEVTIYAFFFFSLFRLSSLSIHLDFDRIYWYSRFPIGVNFNLTIGSFILAPREYDVSQNKNQQKPTKSNSNDQERREKNTQPREKFRESIEDWKQKKKKELGNNR